MDPKVNIERDDGIVIAVDSTGIKVTNRGKWILDKLRRKKRKRKGFIKIHVAVAVNIKSKKMVSMNVTKETIHDGNILNELVGDVYKNNNIQKV